MNDAIRIAVAKMNEAEAALAGANAAITDDIRSLVPADERAALEASYDRAFRAVSVLHRRLDKAIKSVPAPRTGK